MRSGFADGLVFFADDPFFHTSDPLADRDEDGLLHQGRALNRTDFAPRHEHRFCRSKKVVEQKDDKNEKNLIAVADLPPA